MSRCIPNMTGDAATELSTLQAEVEFWKYRCNESVSHASELDIALYDTEAENEKLRAKLEQVKRDRDAAVADIKALLQKADYVGVCWACKYGNTDCRSDNCGEAEWRGPEEE